MQQTLLISIALVILVVAMFLRRTSAVAAAGAAVPLSLLGTLAVMWVLGYLARQPLAHGADHLGRLRGRRRHRHDREHGRLTERGMKPLQAALVGARQIGFTVVSITVSLIAVFIPLLFMGGIVGRLFREFSVTLAIAVAHLGRRVADPDADDGRAPGAPRAAPAGPARPGDRCRHGRR